MKTQETLENDLIRLIKIKEVDFENLYNVASDPEIWKQHPTHDRYKRKVFQSFFDGAITSKSTYLIYIKSTNTLIGSTRYYNYNKTDSSIAIGYTFLAKEYWGGKYNQSVKKLLIGYAFQYASTILFHVGGENIRSQKAVLALGAKKREGVEITFNDTEPPHFEYEINKKNWLD